MGTAARIRMSAPQYQSIEILTVIITGMILVKQASYFFQMLKRDFYE